MLLFILFKQDNDMIWVKKFIKSKTKRLKKIHQKAKNKSLKVIR